MTFVKDIRKTVTDTTPVYAALGATDLAVERLREARDRAAAIRLDLDVSAIQDRAVKRFEQVTEQVQQIPAQVRNQRVEAAGKARETYTGLAVRGEKLVKRVRNQKSTKDLFAQAGSTVSLGRAPSRRSARPHTTPSAPPSSPWPLVAVRRGPLPPPSSTTSGRPVARRPRLRSPPPP